MFAIFGVPVDAAYHLVAGLTGLLTPVLGSVAAVTAIVAVTMAVRILLMPLNLRAFRGQVTAARLAPQLLALRQRYARQPERLHSEMSALYRREGTSMFASLTPILFQWPFLSVMYLLFRSPVVAGKPNTLLAHDLLGVPLSTHWLSGAGPASMTGLVFAGMFALLAGLCWLICRLGRMMSAPAAAPASGSGQPGSGALVKVLPYLTVVIAAFAPLAAGIYLLTSMGWSLAERKFFVRRESPDMSRRDQRRFGGFRRVRGVRGFVSPEQQGAKQPDRR